ncbi:hypothetical protein QYF36_010561 [Acer negundo]|nr:hypothetical protein QYF36_010561 [Acer negundo]
MDEQNHDQVVAPCHYKRLRVLMIIKAFKPWIYNMIETVMIRLLLQYVIIRVHRALIKPLRESAIAKDRSKQVRSGKEEKKMATVVEPPNGVRQRGKHYYSMWQTLFEIDTKLSNLRNHCLMIIANIFSFSCYEG